MQWDQLPVYLAAELLAGVAAALLFGLLSRTPADRLPPVGWTSGLPTPSARRRESTTA